MGALRLATAAAVLATAATAYRVVPNNHGTPWPASVYTQAKATVAQMTLTVSNQIKS